MNRTSIIHCGQNCKQVIKADILCIKYETPENSLVLHRNIRKIICKMSIKIQVTFQSVYQNMSLGQIRQTVGILCKWLVVCI